VIHQFTSRQFLAFLFTGGIAAGVNFGSRIVYSHWLSFSAAVVLAYLTGMVVAFVLAKLFVFKSSEQSIHRAAGFFILVNLIAVAQTWGISMLMLHILLPRLGVVPFAPGIAHAAGIAVPVFTSYLGHKRWSFGR